MSDIKLDDQRKDLKLSSIGEYAVEHIVKETEGLCDQIERWITKKGTKMPREHSRVATIEDAESLIAFNFQALSPLLSAEAEKSNKCQLYMIACCLLDISSVYVTTQKSALSNNPRLRLIAFELLYSIRSSIEDFWPLFICNQSSFVFCLFLGFFCVFFSNRSCSCL